MGLRAPGGPGRLPQKNFAPKVVPVVRALVVRAPSRCSPRLGGGGARSLTKGSACGDTSEGCSTVCMRLARDVNLTERTLTRESLLELSPLALGRVASRRASEGGPACHVAMLYAMSCLTQRRRPELRPKAVRRRVASEPATIPSCSVHALEGHLRPYQIVTEASQASALHVATRFSFHPIVWTVTFLARGVPCDACLCTSGEPSSAVSRGGLGS